MKSIKKRFAVFLFVLFAAAFAQIAHVKVLATTDLHSQFLSYNYYTDSADENCGLTKLVTLIQEERAKVGDSNAFYFDAGDFIQGTPFGDYMAKIDGMKKTRVYPGMEVLDYAKCDVQTFGNHEFNYGLDFLERVTKSAKHPMINANVYRASSDKLYALPYVILERDILFDDGKTQKIKFGVIGAVPPQIEIWDNANIGGKLRAEDIVQSVKRFLPDMKKNGADVIIALCHTGLNPHGVGVKNENAAYELSKLSGVDIVVAGHSHAAFPSEKYKGMKNIDAENGLVFGKPVSISGSYADALGVIDFDLEKENGAWKIKNAKSSRRVLKGANVKAERKAEKILSKPHKAVLQYIRRPIGKTETPINSFFALARDDPSLQLTNDAQMRYAKKALSKTEYKDLPVLSAAAPFKCGGRMGAEYYTNIPKGNLAVRNMADLYVYANTLYILKINGRELREWLERAAGQFNTIEVKKTDEQMLVNNNFPTYNFDVIDGVSYTIDITKESRYDVAGKLTHPESHRIAKLQYKGKDVKDDDEFAIATNNYRASGGGYFPNLSLAKAIYAAPDENRQIIVDYISELKTINSRADMNWHFERLPESVHVVLQSSPAAKAFAGNDFTFLRTNGSGFAEYEVTVSR